MIDTRRIPQVFKKRPASGNTASGESEVPASDVQNDLEYVVPVTIGTPGVTLNLDFDTGLSFADKTHLSSSLFR